MLNIAIHHLKRSCPTKCLLSKTWQNSKVRSMRSIKSMKVRSRRLSWKFETSIFQRTPANQFISFSPIKKKKIRLWYRLEAPCKPLRIFLSCISVEKKIIYLIIFFFEVFRKSYVKFKLPYLLFQDRSTLSSFEFSLSPETLRSKYFIIELFTTVSRYYYRC